MALASGWGTGMIYTWGPNYDYDLVVDGTFRPADNNKVHCPLPTFEEWRALPVYERYHPPIAPQAQPGLIVNGHLITSDLCWCTSKRAGENRGSNHDRGGSYMRLLEKWRVRCYRLGLQHPDGNLCALH
jgi:hypothetical protein